MLEDHQDQKNNDLKYLLEKTKDEQARNWYANQVLIKGWSGRTLDDAIKSNLFEKQKKAINNFKEPLPKPHFQLANDILKSPYNFSFLTLENNYIEHEL